MGQPKGFAERQECVILSLGGSVLVRRRIQTPSDAKVLSVVQPEGEVVLGASPPARLPRPKSGAACGGTMTTSGGAPIGTPQ